MRGRLFKKVLSVIIIISFLLAINFNINLLECNLKNNYLVKLGNIEAKASTVMYYYDKYQ
jgi:hypothetical protein